MIWEALGFMGGLIRAIPARVWVVIGAVALVLVLVWRVQAWAHGKDVAIHRAQGQRNTAILAYVLTDRNLITARANNATLTAAISRQNAAVEALRETSARRLQEAAVGLSRAQAQHRDDEARMAVLRRPLGGSTACARADEAAARAREALR